MDNLETFDMSVTVESTIADREFMKSVAVEAMKLPSEVIKNMNALNDNPMNYIVGTDTVASNGGRPNISMLDEAGGYIVNENPPLESNNRWTQLDWNVAREYQYPPMSERFAQMFHEALPRELERVQFDNNITVRTKSRRKKAHTDPSIVINEETGERFKWIDGKLVNLDEQDSTN